MIDKTQTTKPTQIEAVYVREMAKFYKVLGDETRLRILYALSQREMCVTDLVDALEMSQSSVSHQLRILRDNGRCAPGGTAAIFFIPSTTSTSSIFSRKPFSTSATGWPKVKFREIKKADASSQKQVRIERSAALFFMLCDIKP